MKFKDGVLLFPHNALSAIFNNNAQKNLVADI